MIAAGAIGTTADMVYGYLVACQEYRLAHQQQQQDEQDVGATGPRKEEGGLGGGER